MAHIGRCASCNSEIVVVQLMRVARGFAMQTTKCPKCRFTMNLVLRHRFPRAATLARRSASERAA
jgi:phage FluMu protein Com